jgi:hypothetical protein
MRIAVLLPVLLFFACGCISAADVRLRYGAELATCAANERAIVDRVGSTEAEDREALELERVRCDAALRAAESGQ